jgi:NhaP-type Na+/H+ or K+/H+ antiporter
LGWSGLFLVGAILLLRRLPAVLALKHKNSSIIKWTDALFMGWFGPIGVAAVFYANLSVQRVGIESIWVVSSLIICASILIHGLTAVPFTKLYGKTNEPVIFDDES